MIMKIAVDVDGVIFDLISVFLNIFNHNYNTTYKKSDITQWEFYKNWGIYENQVYEIFYQIYNNKFSISLIDEKIPEYLRIIKKDHHVDILSARNHNFKSQLIQILLKYNINKGQSYDRIILVDEKPYDLKLKYEYDLYIDDNPNLIEPIKKKKDITLFLFDQPWNKVSICNKNIIRIKFWKDILIEIKKLKKTDILH